MDRLKKEWATFSEAAIPSDAPEIQHSEMRRAFYAGATVMLALALEASDNTEDVGESILSGIREELSQFAVDVRNGKA